MKLHNAANERVKRHYFTYLKEAKRQSEASVDAVAAAIARFESYDRYRDFKTFHIQKAVRFKRWMQEQRSVTSGKPLSTSTVHGTVSHLKRFFQWLAGQPGYKSRISYSDAEYFNVSANDVRAATARRSQRVPTIEQVRHVVEQMPAETEVEKRNRAILAFTVLTGARDNAVASAKLKHVDFVAGTFYQDAREVRTKFRKTFKTAFFPVGDEFRRIVKDWADYLRTDKLWGMDDPLFPKTAMTIGRNRKFEHVELSREHWQGTDSIRKIFRGAFESAGLPYYNPHSLRHTLAKLGEECCRTPEEFKAWSQNLGHEGVMTTFFSYGRVDDSRQVDLIRGLAQGPAS